MCRQLCSRYAYMYLTYMATYLLGPPHTAAGTRNGSQIAKEPLTVNLLPEGKLFEVEGLSMSRNSSESHLTLCVIHQRTGIVVFRKIFPLRKFYTVWYDLDRHLVNVTPGRLIYLHIEGDAILGLRNATLRMTLFGSLLLKHLNLRSSFVSIFVRGGKMLYEGAAIGGSISSTVSLIAPHVTVFLSNVPREDVKNSSYGSSNISMTEGSLESKRWKFCENQGVMDDLCDECEPYNINHKNTLLNNSITNSSHYTDISEVPIIITAGQRVEYLYQSLKSYLRAPGANKTNFFSILGSHSNQTIELLEIFNISYSVISPAVYGKTDFFPFYFYREVYEFALNRFVKKSNYLIFLEEDVEIELDFFSYFSQTVHLLVEDPTLYCITSHSSNGLRGLGHDESQVYRANAQVGWGYALSATFIKETLQHWKKVPDYSVLRESVFDGWIYTHVRKGRECVFPEISRIRHFGIGMNTDYWITERTFLSMPTTKSEAIVLANLDRISLAKYDKFLISAISKSQTVTQSPCAKNFFSSLEKRGSWVIFYHYNSSNKDTGVNFFSIGNCFKAWTFSEQGQHKGISIVRLSLQQTFYLVAFPESPFSFLLPKGVTPMDIRNMSQEETKEVLAIQQEIAYDIDLFKGQPTSDDVMDAFGNADVQDY